MLFQLLITHIIFKAVPLLLILQKFVKNKIKVEKKLKFLYNVSSTQLYKIYIH